MAFKRSAPPRIASRPAKGPHRALDREASRLLRIAWHTELAARVGDEFDDPTLRRAAAQTLPVQAYYAVFSAARRSAGSPARRPTPTGRLHDEFESQRVRRAAGRWAVTLAGDPEPMAANQRFLLDVIRFSQPLDSATAGPEPEQVGADWDNEAFPEYVAEMGPPARETAAEDRPHGRCPRRPALHGLRPVGIRTAAGKTALRWQVLRAWT